MTTRLEPRVGTSSPRAIERAALPVYVGLVLVSGVTLLLWTWTRYGGSGLTSLDFAFWLVLSLAAECFWLQTPNGSGMLSMSLAVNFASFFVLPAPLVLAAGALSVGFTDLILHRRGPLRACFNAAQTVISMAAALATMRLLGGSEAIRGGAFLLRHPAASLAGPAVFLAVNTIAVAGVLSIAGRKPFGSTWRENFGFGYHFLSCAGLLLVGLSLVVATESVGYIAGLLDLFLLWLVRDAYNRYVRERARKLAGQA